MLMLALLVGCPCRSASCFFALLVLPGLSGFGSAGTRLTTAALLLYMMCPTHELFVVLSRGPFSSYSFPFFFVSFKDERMPRRCSSSTVSALRSATSARTFRPS